jgi:pyruvate carboxylase
MPGRRSRPVSVARADGACGDVLLSIEAMKMETALHADRDGTIAEISFGPATRSIARTC